MHVTFDDQKYEFRPVRMSATELIGLKRYGLYPNKAEFLQALHAEDPEALQALHWLLRRRAGESSLKYSETPDFWEYTITLDDEEKANIRANLTPEQAAALDPAVRAELGYVDGEEPEAGGAAGEAESAVSDATSPPLLPTTASGPGSSNSSAPTSTSTSST